MQNSSAKQCWLAKLRARSHIAGVRRKEAAVGVTGGYGGFGGGLRRRRGYGGLRGYGDMIRIALTFSPYGELWAVCPASSSPTFPITSSLDDVGGADFFEARPNLPTGS